MKRSLFLAFSLLLAALPVSAATKVLTLEQALNTAFQHQPQLQQAQASLMAAKAHREQARASLLPQVGLGANYLPSGHSNSANLSLSAEQLLYDWGQNSNRVEAASALFSAQEDALRLSLLQVAQGVRTAYFEARAAESMRNVAQESLRNQQRHLDQVKGFVEIGTRPPIDLAQAQKDFANAQVSLIDAQNAFEVAKARLNQAMGVEGAADFTLARAQMSPVPGEEQSLDSLLKEALKNHPEVATLAKQRQAQSLTVSSIKAVAMPALRATTRLAGDTVAPAAPDWQIGVTFSWSLFNGGATQAQVAEAEANLTKLDAQVDALRQSIRLAVEQARLAVKAGKAALTAAGTSTRNAQEQLKLAEGRYQAGLGSVIELGDAQLALTDARAQEIQQDYKLANARIQLLTALGRM